MLDIHGLSVAIGAKVIFTELDLNIPKGQKAALIGRNGSGKSSLALSIIGHPNYTCTAGNIVFDGQDITSLPLNERANLGIFLSWQHPIALPGVPVSRLIRLAQQHFPQQELSPMNYKQFTAELDRCLERLQLPASFKQRNLNQGFSGGEKKLCEFLQILMLKPRFIILDEIEAGLDVESKKHIAKLLRGPDFQDTTILFISHTLDFLRDVQPDRIHVLDKGKLVESGTIRLLTKIETRGYS